VLRHLLLNTLPLYTQEDRDSDIKTTTRPLHDILPQSLVSLRLVDNTSDPAIRRFLAKDPQLLAQAVAAGARISKLLKSTRSPGGRGSPGGLLAGQPGFPF